MSWPTVELPAGVTVGDIARTCHEANRAYCLSMGDTSQPSWEDAPDWQKESARLGVEFLLTDERLNPVDAHHSWLEHKRVDGWVYGPVKDAEAKTHPCMVEYHELPAAQRRKDYLFAAIVRALSKAIAQ